MGYRNQRIAYGSTLVEEGKKNDRLVVLDADLSGSTMGKMFEQAFPDRHYEMGIAEADMPSVAAGLSLTGWIPLLIPLPYFQPDGHMTRSGRPLPLGT